MKSFIVIGLEGFPLISSGDDLSKIIIETASKNAVELEDGDVIVAAQKIFSKAENRVIRLKNVSPSKKAKQIARQTGKGSKFVELVLSETKTIWKKTREIFIVEDKRGIVCINAGIDKSNVQGKGNFALLPKNPDESARKCRAGIKKLTGKTVAVVICDTFSRPFRKGQVNFAIGMAGINPFKDYRQKRDLFGQLLKVKNVAVVDEIAAAGELLMGQAKERMPVTIIKGLKDLVDLSDEHRLNELLISEEADLFRYTLGQQPS